MSEITINDLGSLGDYATSIKQFSSDYRKEIASVNRHFTEKVDGAQADAINAFFKKLNAIQTLMFEQYPESLENYADAVDKYHTAVSNAGFTTKAYSSDSDIAQVSQKLRYDQYDTISDITSQLQSALTQAAEAMGTDVESVSSINSKASSLLSDLSQARQQTDDTLQEAFKRFQSELTEAIETLKTINSAVSQAEAVTQVPSSLIFSSISSGELTSGKMYYLDGMSTKTDVKVMKALLKGKLEKAVPLDPDQISSGMYTVMAKEMTGWLEAANSSVGDKNSPTYKENIGHFNAFLKAMETVDHEQVKKLSKNLLFAGDRNADGMEYQMYQLYQKDPSKLNSPEMDQYQSRLTTMNQYINVMRAVAVLDLGTKSETINTSGSSQVSTVSKYAKIEFVGSDKEDTAIELSVHGRESVVNRYFPNGRNNPNVKGDITSQDSWKIQDKSYTLSRDISKITSDVTDTTGLLASLDKERLKLKVKFWADIAKGVTVTSVGVLQPELLPFVSAGVALSSSDVVGAAASSGEEATAALGNETVANLGKGLPGFAQIMQSEISYQEGMDKLSEKEKEARARLLNIFANKGSMNIVDNSTDELISQDSDHFHDFNALLRLHELDTNGLTNYVANFNDGETVHQKLEKITTTKKKKSDDNRLKISKNVQDYLEGKSSKLTFGNMTNEEYRQFVYAINEMKITGVSKDFNKQYLIDYLDTRFGYLKNHHFYKGGN